MSFRKLRIAFSVTCGITCVLLIVLWVRSYTAADFCEGSIWSHWFKVESFGGQFVAKHASSEDVDWSIHSYPMEEIVSETFMAERGLPRFELGLGLLLLPYWFLVATTAAFATVPWIRWRFSLRSLLIAMTLVAVVLGLIVWAAKS